LEPARYKGAYGGRGSGKSHFFAEDTIETALRFPGDAGEGLRALELRELQKSLKQSSKFLLESKLKQFGLGEADGFKIYTDRIGTPKDGVIEFQGMQDHTADTIKSYEGFHRARVEEAQSLSARSLQLLRPTIRWEDKTKGLYSEMAFSWNPLREVDPVDVLLRGKEKPTGAIVVRANYNDNPWFPSVLDTERKDCLRISPGQYDHIWNGGYATVLEGAYFAEGLNNANDAGRITTLSPDPYMRYRVFCDLGGTGAKADAFAMWIAQFISHRILVLNYYEAVGQPLGTHLNWLKDEGYTPGSTDIWLPHDGDTNDRVHDVSFASGFRDAGYDVTVVENQGKGAAKARIEAARRAFPNISFSDEATKAGRSALGWYHEKKDEKRNVGLGPEHDWSSHGADAFRYLAVGLKKAEAVPDIDIDVSWVA
jgi:phage terminase large subunit